jgi:hypothetical protein
MEGKRRYAVHLAKPSDAKDIVDFLNACGNLTFFHFQFCLQLQVKIVRNFPLIVGHSMHVH